MECCARLNTRITKPYEAQEKGQQLGKTGMQYANLCGSFIVWIEWNFYSGVNVAF